MRTAGGLPRRLCRFAKQVFVCGRDMYPGNAKNSIETLRRDGSTLTADKGMLLGIANAAGKMKRSTTQKEWMTQNCYD